MLNVVDLTRPARRALLPPFVGQLTAAHLSAGLTAGLFYAFGAIPIYGAAAGTLGLSRQAATSAFFAIFMTSTLTSIALSLRYRQPLPIGFTVPGLVLLASAARRYSHAEMVGACLVTGAIMLVLGLLGVGERLLRWLPLPIVLGAFAGNLFGLRSPGRWTCGRPARGRSRRD